MGSPTTEQLQTTPAPHMWPIWATEAHLAGARVYWLCEFLGEAGAERTPSTNSATEAVELDLWTGRVTREEGAPGALFVSYLFLALLLPLA
jgi:hypothetical protein